MDVPSLLQFLRLSETRLMTVSFSELKIQGTLDWLKRGPASTRDHVEFSKIRQAAIAAIEHLQAENMHLTAALSGQVVVPSGWRVVPMEATPDMVRAAPGHSGVRDTWRAMIAAAPPPSSTAGEGG